MRVLLLAVILGIGLSLTGCTSGTSGGGGVTAPPPENSGAEKGKTRPGPPKQ